MGYRDTFDILRSDYRIREYCTKSMTKLSTYEQLGRAVIELEGQAINALLQQVDSNFGQACQLILQASGRVVVVGMGKSGHIGGKIAATLASTGTPAFFVHPGEASHGDLGMITAVDTVLAISNSGETSEILTILPMIKRMNVKLIAFTGNPDSTLAQNSNIVIDVGVKREACPLGLAPTASTTAPRVFFSSSIFVSRPGINWSSAFSGLAWHVPSAAACDGSISCCAA